MSNSKRSSAKFWLLASVVVLLSAAAAAALWPTARAEARSNSASLASQAQQANGGEAQSDYQLAVWLNPRNQSARLGLANAELAADQPAPALSALQGAGEGSRPLLLKTEGYIETGRYEAAASTASLLTAPASASQNDVLMAAVADKLAGRTSAVSALINRLSSSQGLQDAARIEAGNLPLASVLYARGLLHSSSVILKSLPESFQRDLLLARIDYAWDTGKSLASAETYLQSAIRDDPAAVAPHQLLATIYRNRNQFTAASTQQSLVAKLLAGRP